jgi:hypothetical protein
LNISPVLVSPTHKRTEGRVPVWGSEFTRLSGLNVKLWVLVVVVVVVVACYRCFGTAEPTKILIFF